MTALATSLQAWFTDRLIRERNASPHTIASYRDTIRLLLTYASQQLGVEPSRLDLAQLDAPLKLRRVATARTSSVRTIQPTSGRPLTTASSTGRPKSDAAATSRSTTAINSRYSHPSGTMRFAVPQAGCRPPAIEPRPNSSRNR